MNNSIMAKKVFEYSPILRFSVSVMILLAFQASNYGASPTRFLAANPTGCWLKQSMPKQKIMNLSEKMMTKNE